MPTASPQAIRTLPWQTSPAAVAAANRQRPNLVFLDSCADTFADGDAPAESRFSLIACDPVEQLEGNFFDPADRERLRSSWERHRIEGAADLGLPLGGLVGFIEYDGRFAFGAYPALLLHDHLEERWIEVGDSGILPPADAPREASSPSPPPPLLTPLRFQRDLNREDFCDRVRRAKDYIAAGDIYQVNLSHRFHADLPEEIDPFDLYLRLRQASPAPQAAWLDLGGKRILSSSPEQFLRLSGRSIQTRPIKGTRPRFRDRERDEKSAYDLLTSPKEVAELIMITDLERNDLGQICEFGSVEAVELLKLERFAQVFHLVSTVEGTLREDIDPVEAINACFPGGSITGAPKKRAREIIAELEPVPRGLYTGAIGCLGFNGESRFSIAIRTAVAANREISFHVGAGIVADSDPEAEWEETLHKATGILRACTTPKV